MKKFEFIFLFAAFLLAQITLAQPVVHNYGSPGSDDYASIVKYPTGGFIVVGTTGGELGSQTDVYLSKLNFSLDCEWTFNIGGMGIERGNDVVVSDDGSIYFCGMAMSNSALGYKNLVGKVDQYGNLLWSQEFGEGVWNEARNIVIDGSGNIVVSTNSFFPNGEELVVVYSLSENGDLSTPIIIETSGANTNMGLEYYNGDLYVLNNHEEVENDHYSVRRINSEGVIIQTYEVGGVIAYDLEVSNNGILVVGEFLNGVLRNPYTCAFNFDGTVAKEVFAVIEFNIWYKAVSSNSEGYTLAGETTDFGWGQQDWLLHRADNLGQYVGGITVGTNKFEVCKDLLVVNDSVYLVGSSNGFQLNNQQQATVYLNETITLPIIDPSVVNNDCFYIGTSELIATENMTFNTIGNNIFQSSIPVNFLKAEVFAIDGKLIFSHKGSNTFEVQGAPGIYFLTFQSEKYSGVQKIIIR